MDDFKLCEEYNRLRAAGFTYRETMVKLGEIFHYSKHSMPKKVQAAFKRTGIEMYKGRGWV